MASPPKSGPSARTFAHDDSLPPLPVPPLAQTLERYLRSW